MARRCIGSVEWYSPDKGYGYLRRGGGGADLFVQAKNIYAADLAAFREDATVAFDVETEYDGQEQAVRVRILRTVVE